MLIRYEIRKLLTRKIMFFCAILLLANFCVCLYHAHSEAEAKHYDQREIYADVFAKLEQACAEDPEAMRAYYQQLKEESDLAYEEWEKQLPMGGEGSVFHYSSPSTLVEGYEDWQIFDQYVDWVNDYPSLVAKTVSNAEHNQKVFELFGIKDDSPNGVYQRKLVDIYSRVLQETDPSAVIVKGWNEYFTYDYGFIFLALTVMVLVVQIGLADSESGMEVIIRTTKKGRWQRGLVKTAAFLIVVALLTMLFKLTELLAVSMEYGLSDPFFSLQNIRVFTYCPYALTILEGALLQMLLTILSASVLALCCLLAASIFRSVLATIGVAGVVLSWNLFCYYFQEPFEWQSMNLLSLSYGIHFRSLPPAAFNNMGTSTLPLAVGVFGLLLLMLLGGIVPAHQWIRPRLSAKRRWNWKRILPKGVCGTRRKPVNKPRSMKFAMLRGEAYKHLRPITVFLVLILLGVHVRQTLTGVSGQLTDEEARLAGYIEKYGENVEQSTLDALQAELEYNAQYTSQDTESKYRKRYLSGEITADEYYSYKVEQNRLKLAEPALQQTISHVSYLLKIEAQDVEAKLFYDRGYTTVLNRGFDWSSYVLVIVLTIGIFSVEYKERFIDILRTTKRGRRELLLNKYVYVLIVVLTASVLLAIFDFSLLWTRYGLDGYTAPLVCIEKYASYPTWMSVGDYITLYFAIRVLAGTVLAAMITGLAILLPQIKLLLPLTVGITMLPYVLAYLGFEKAAIWDYTYFLDGEQLLYKLLGEQQWAYCIAPLIAIVVTITLTLVAQRRMNR